MELPIEDNNFAAALAFAQLRKSTVTTQQVDRDGNLVNQTRDTFHYTVRAEDLGLKPRSDIARNVLGGDGTEEILPITLDAKGKPTGIVSYPAPPDFLLPDEGPQYGSSGPSLPMQQLVVKRQRLAEAEQALVQVTNRSKLPVVGRYYDVTKAQQELATRKADYLAMLGTYGNAREAIVNAADTRLRAQDPSYHPGTSNYVYVSDQQQAAAEALEQKLQQQYPGLPEYWPTPR